MDVHQIFDTEEEREALKQVVKVSTIGYAYGTYQGFTPWHDFKDKELERQCNEAYSKNPGRNNGNEW